MSHALRTFGYNVSDRFVGILIQTFDKYGKVENAQFDRENDANAGGLYHDRKWRYHF